MGRLADRHGRGSTVNPNPVKCKSCGANLRSANLRVANLCGADPASLKVSIVFNERGIVSSASKDISFTKV